MIRTTIGENGLRGRLGRLVPRRAVSGSRNKPDNAYGRRRTPKGIWSGCFPIVFLITVTREGLF